MNYGPPNPVTTTALGQIAFLSGLILGYAGIVRTLARDYFRGERAGWVDVSRHSSSIMCGRMRQSTDGRARLFAVGAQRYCCASSSAEWPMKTPRRRISIASCALLITSISAARFVAGGSRLPGPMPIEPEACSLLTPAEAGAAFEETSVAGKQLSGVPKSCFWSHSPTGADSSRRVVLVIVTADQFQIAKRGTFTKIEPAAGVGDEAFYEVYPNNPLPFIWVKKGATNFTIRIITVLKPKPAFTLEQAKAKLLVLAKAAAGKA